MRLRYAGVCRVCGIDLPAQCEAIYERTTKTVRCVSHAENTVLLETPQSGVAGASARREFKRRKVKREERVRAKRACSPPTR